MILVAAAGGQQDAIGELFQKGWDGGRTLEGIVQEVQAELQEDFSRCGFAPGVIQESWNVWQAQRDANPREQLGLRHCLKNHQNTTVVPNAR